MNLGSKPAIISIMLSNIVRSIYNNPLLYIEPTKFKGNNSITFMLFIKNQSSNFLHENGHSFLKIEISLPRISAKSDYFEEAPKKYFPAQNIAVSL
jgi:hypothetical protein